MKNKFLLVIISLLLMISTTVAVSAQTKKSLRKYIPNTNSNTISFGKLPLYVGLTDKGSPFYFKDKSSDSKVSKRVWFICYEGYSEDMKNSPVYMYCYKEKQFLKVGTYNTVFTGPNWSNEFVDTVTNNVGNSDNVGFDPEKEYKLNCKYFSFIVGLLKFDQNGKYSGKVVKFQTATNPFYNKDKTLKSKNIKAWKNTQMKFQKDLDI